MSARMSTRFESPELRRMRRKRDQAWEMAGLARQDGDRQDEERWTKEAHEWAVKIREFRELMGDLP